jgi:hypothetical protein
MEPIDFNDELLTGKVIRELIVENSQLMDQLKDAPQLRSDDATRAWMSINIQSARTPVHRN